MGSIMNMISGLIHHRRNQQQLRTERVEEIGKLTREINQTTAGIKQVVRKYQQEEDPLQALMNVLNSPRNHH